MTVAALFVETDGAYFGLDGVDPWDEARDARLYTGPWPVVAHPPCNRWVSYGAREKRGDDGGCFQAALNAVRWYGGVLEHPARSQAWAHFHLPMPSSNYGWMGAIGDPGLSAMVDQYAYGFPTRKQTWLYTVGVSPWWLLQTRAPFGHPGCDAMWSTDRSKTPEPFRDVLIAMARSAHPPGVAA